MYNKFLKKDGEVLLDLTNDSVSSSVLLEGYTAHDKSGEDIIGEFTLDEELTTQDDLISQIQAAVDSLPEASGEPVLQSKTVTPSTSSQTIKPDSGYDGLSQVTINAMTTATQATPSISVSSSGLITASATQSAGYVSAGTKSATKQLTTKSATTYTPTTSNQTIASGTYCSGVQTIKGDANLKAENIAEGVSIFGITGTHSGGGSSGGGFENNTDLCTINLSSDYIITGIGYYGGDFLHHADAIGLSSTTLSAVCGSVLYVAQNGFYSANASSGEILCSTFGGGFTYRVPSVPTTVSISITTD